MRDSDISVELLMKETFSMTENYKFDFPYHFESPRLSLSNSNSNLYPVGPGIIYKIVKGTSTFILRGLPTTNIKNFFDTLPHNLDLEKSKLSADDQLLFLKAEDFKEAELVANSLLNRRFPYEEDMVCNIADPGFSWWYKDDGQGRVEIFFKSFGIDRAAKCLQLGPMITSQKITELLSKSRHFIKNLFPLNEFSLDERSFIFSSINPNHPHFILFKSIFSDGQFAITPEHFFEGRPELDLLALYSNLALARKFWIDVKKELG